MERDWVDAAAFVVQQEAVRRDHRQLSAGRNSSDQVW